VTLLRVAAVLALAALFGSTVPGEALPPEAARARFATPAAWDAYVDTEMEQVVLLVAHLEQAWAEAKRTGDDDVRRTAKAPRRQREQARQLVDKLSSCAEMNGAAFSPLVLWRRIEAELPQRRMDVALPE
jgi:hypothetical protein